MGLIHDYFNETRKPEGKLGNIMIAGMNIGHAMVSDWGFSHLPEEGITNAVDLGCGGGRSVSVLLKRYPDAHVTGIDYSDLSVEKSRKYNRRMIRAGRCTIAHGDVSDLTLPRESYDLATAFETIYFWPDLSKCFANVLNILKPDGLFMICMESDGKDAASLHYAKIIEGMKNYTIDDIEKALKEAGFSHINSDHHSSKPWITVLAEK